MYNPHIRNDSLKYCPFSIMFMQWFRIAPRWWWRLVDYRWVYHIALVIQLAANAANPMKHVDLVNSLHGTRGQSHKDHRNKTTGPNKLVSRTMCLLPSVFWVCHIFGGRPNLCAPNCCDMFIGMEPALKAPQARKRISSENHSDKLYLQVTNLPKTVC